MAHHWNALLRLIRGKCALTFASDSRGRLLLIADCPETSSVSDPGHHSRPRAPRARVCTKYWHVCCLAAHWSKSCVHYHASSTAAWRLEMFNLARISVAFPVAGCLLAITALVVPGNSIAQERHPPPP